MMGHGAGTSRNGKQERPLSDLVITGKPVDQRFQPDLQTLVGFWWPKIIGKRVSIWRYTSSRHSMKNELGVAITTSKAHGIKTGRLYHSLGSQCDLVAVTVMGQWTSHLFWVVQGPLTPFAGCYLQMASQVITEGNEWIGHGIFPAAQPHRGVSRFCSLSSKVWQPQPNCRKLGRDAHLRANGLSWTQHCFCCCDRMGALWRGYYSGTYGCGWSLHVDSNSPNITFNFTVYIPFARSDIGATFKDSWTQRFRLVFIGI